MGIIIGACNHLALLHLGPITNVIIIIILAIFHAGNIKITDWEVQKVK